MTTTTHQWLGPDDRLTLWRVTTGPDSQTHVGRLTQISAGLWSSVDYGGGSTAHRLYLHDTRELAADALCARLGIARVGLPGEGE